MRQIEIVFAATAALWLAGYGTAPAEVSAHPDPLLALESGDPALAANKRLVFDFWRSIVNAGHVELADELLSEAYVQHSPVLPTGRAAFKQVFSAVPRRSEIPELVEPPLVAIIAEGSLVVMALIERLQSVGAGGYTSTHFNLFRIEDGRLAEHWHSVQTSPGPGVPAPEDGGPVPVTGLVGVDQLALLDAESPVLAANKRLVFDAWRQIADAGRSELAGLYLTRDFVSHDPNAAGATGANLPAPFATGVERPIETSLRDPLVAMVAEGDLVVQVRMHEHAHPARAGHTYTTTSFDMFRVTDGRLSEHWNAAMKATTGGAPMSGARSTAPAEPNDRPADGSP